MEGTILIQSFQTFMVVTLSGVLLTFCTFRPKLYQLVRSLLLLGTSSNYSCTHKGLLALLKCIYSSSILNTSTTMNLNSLSWIYPILQEHRATLPWTRLRAYLRSLLRFQTSTLSAVFHTKALSLFILG